MTPGFASSLHLCCSYSAPSYTQLLLKKLLGLGEQKGPPKHTSSPKQAALNWLLHPVSQGVSRDEAVSAALPPPFPGEKQRGEKKKAYPISCLWHVEVRTLFYNNPINADEMMMAGHEAPFGEAPSVGSLLVQAALPRRAEGSLSLSPSLPGWS